MKKLTQKQKEAGLFAQPLGVGCRKGTVSLWAFGQAEHPLDFIFNAAFKPIVKGIPLRH